MDDAFARAFAEAPELFSSVERAAVVATYFEGRSIVGAGVHLGVCTPTAAERMRRARRRLQSWLARKAAA